MKFFATSVIHELDQYTILHEPISSIDLMERAARAIFEELCNRIERSRPIVVFAGQGNNGGDALAVARLLLDAGYSVNVYLFNPQSSGKSLSPDCEINRNRLLENYASQLVEITVEFVKPILTDDTVIIDGLFGSGLSRPLQGGFAYVVQFLNQSKGYKIAIDIPSGLMGEVNQIATESSILKADLTLSLQFPKLAFFLSDNAPYIGEWKVLDIQLHPDGIDQTSTNLFYLQQEDISPLLSVRQKFTHKGNYGHAFIVAGKWGMAGASILASKAALRTGAGLVTLHGPYNNCAILQTAVTEAIYQCDSSDEVVSRAPIPSQCNVVAVGPGIGTRIDTAAMLRMLLTDFEDPMVIDADALNIISQAKDLLELIPKNSILTPHPKEFDRLFGKSNWPFERIAKAQKAAETWGVIIVLKGAHTVIATPNQDLYFNSTGNPGMATAGSGDVLTGIITGLLAQGYSPEDAAKLGVFLHGRAGDIAAKRRCEEALIASDIVEALAEAFNSIR